METPRLILFLSLGLVSMLLWQAWEQDYGVKQDITVAPIGPVAEVQPRAEGVPSFSTEDLEVKKQELPRIVEPTTRPIIVQTDVFRVEINTQGGGLQRVELLQYPIDIKIPEEPFVLMDQSPELFYIAQGGLLSAQEAPTHENVFVADKYDYHLQEKDVLRVPLRWKSDNGLIVNKVYEFSRNDYLIKVSYEVDNGSSEVWKGRSYSQIKRNDPGRSGRRIIYTYTGAVLSSPEERYEKIDFDDIEEQKLAQDITNGWAAMIQHYFVAALVPVDKAQPYHYYTMALSENRFAIGTIAPGIVLAAGEKGRLDEQLYVGPKDQESLSKIADGLELTVDFGVLWFIAQPLFATLSWLHDKVGNWGWAIILVTILLKLIFFPLSAAGYRSMAKMRQVQPRIMSIRERYKTDKARLNQAMMQIYKEEKINPLGGCFPILVQIPVFIALYWTLLESVEMRQASFILWLQDLSSPDPYYVLPVIMGVTMLLQQKLNPTPMDPVQEKVMMIMPFAFTIFFAFFPSGLVLYWVANNVLSIAQQWKITRDLERAGLSSKK